MKTLSNVPAGVTGESTVPLLVDVQRVSEVLQLSPRTIYRLADRGLIPAGVKIGGSRRWPLTELEEFVRTGCKSAAKARAGRA